MTINKDILKEVNEVACEVVCGKCDINKTTKVYKKLLKEIKRIENNSPFTLHYSILLVYDPVIDPTPGRVEVPISGLY